MAFCRSIADYWSFGGTFISTPGRRRVVGGPMPRGLKEGIDEGRSLIVYRH